jgi:hypothetical protein
VSDDELTIRETTQPAIGNRLVGVANIWERDLPDDAGAVGSRLSASVTIVDPATGDMQQRMVVVGNTLDLGDGRYRIVNIDEGGGDLGAITLRRIV